MQSTHSPPRCRRCCAVQTSHHTPLPAAHHPIPLLIEMSQVWERPLPHPPIHRAPLHEPTCAVASSGTMLCCCSSQCAASNPVSPSPPTLTTSRSGSKPATDASQPQLPACSRRRQGTWIRPDLAAAATASGVDQLPGAVAWRRAASREDSSRQLGEDVCSTCRDERGTWSLKSLACQQVPCSVRQLVAATS